MPDTLELWSSAAWRDEATAWVLAALRRAGTTPRGPLTEVHTRFWSTVQRIETDRGRFWFKENAPGQRAEAALVAQLARLVPGRVVEPLAVDTARGWLLSPDAGRTLREAGATESAWRRVLREYAEVQRSLVPVRDAVLTTGVTVLDPAGASAYLLEQVDRQAGLPADHPFHLPADEARRVRDGEGMVAAAADELGSLGLPMSLDHNDLHDANAFAPGSSEDHLRFFDLGDAVWGHPLTTLRVPASVMLDDGLPPSTVRSVLDDALGVWSDLAPVEAMRAALPAAFRLGALSRYESWRRLLVDQPTRVQREFRDAQSGWLARAVGDEGFDLRG